MRIYIQGQLYRDDVDALLFDLDGTLVESTGAILEILTHWSKQQALDVQQVIQFSHGKRTIDIVRYFIKSTEVERHYQDLTAQFLHVAHQARAVQGAAQLLQQLNQQHVPWAIVSSSERKLIQARLSAAGLPQPQVVISAETIEYGKPHPEGYLNAARALKIPIQACVVFEDAPAGVEAALYAGANCIGLGQQLKRKTECSIEYYEQIKVEKKPSEEGL